MSGLVPPFGQTEKGSRFVQLGSCTVGEEVLRVYFYLQYLSPQQKEGGTIPKEVGDLVRFVVKENNELRHLIGRIIGEEPIRKDRWTKSGKRLLVRELETGKVYKKIKSVVKEYKGDALEH